MVLLDQPLEARSLELARRRPQPMMPLAQLRASWQERLSSLQAHLLLLAQLLLSLPLELLVRMVQKPLLSAVSLVHQPLVVSWDPRQQLVASVLHLLEAAATICYFPSSERHWVAEASFSLEKSQVQRARQLRRPEMWIQIFEKISPRRTSPTPGLLSPHRCHEQNVPCPRDVDTG